MSPLSSRLRIARSFLGRSARVTSGPTALAVEVNTICNLRCSMCARTKQMPQQPGDMDLELFRGLIESGRDHLEQVTLSGMGEPLLWPHIGEAIRICREAGVGTVMPTNATLLDEERARELIESGLSMIVMAFDGTTKQVYEEYRRGAVFEQVERNIRRFLELNRRARSPVHSVIQMVNLPRNTHQIPEFIRMWRGSGVSLLRIKQNDEFEVPEQSVQPQWRANGDRRPCVYLWQGPTLVRRQGELFMCCFSGFFEPSPHRAGEMTLAQFHDSEYVQHNRRLMLEGRSHEIEACRHCMIPKPRFPFTLPILLTDALTARKWGPLVERLGLWSRLPLFRP